MRPLLHPGIQDVSVESILYALSDPVRIAILVDIVGQECPQSCSTFLRVLDRPIPKSTLSQHFKILRESGLIRSERHGVEVRNTSRCAEVDARFPGLITSIVKAHMIELEEAAPRKSRTKKSPPAVKQRSAAPGESQRRLP